MAKVSTLKRQKANSILLPGMGAVGTTLIAGVELIRNGFAKPFGSVALMGTIRLGKRTEDRRRKSKILCRWRICRTSFLAVGICSRKTPMNRLCTPVFSIRKIWTSAARSSKHQADESGF
jgi:hypothetical protein